LNSAPTCFTVAAIILAAGEARRMGRTKQLLPLGKGTLVSHTVEVALGAGFTPVIVVVGAEAAVVQAAIAAKPVEIAHNNNWRSGMGSSISAGVCQLQQLQAESAAVAILLADQPLVTSEHLTQMKRLLVTSGAPIIAAEYNGTVGVPALFRRQFLPQLAALTGEGGAKPLLRDARTVRFELPEAATDIDTPADLPALDALRNLPKSY
jgi:molybdenum cofactor cytidylyltransferase